MITNGARTASLAFVLLLGCGRTTYVTLQSDELRPALQAFNDAWGCELLREVTDSSESTRVAIVDEHGLKDCSGITNFTGLGYPSVSIASGLGREWTFQVFAHEMGHALGLNHVSEPGQVMSAGWEPWSSDAMSRFVANLKATGLECQR